MNQLLTLMSLYSEFIACLFAASILSLFVGWMISRSSAKKQLNAAKQSWESKLNTLEDAANADTDNLEEQLQDLAVETKALKATNKVLTESLKKNDGNIQKARAEAIELNRQHAETQERLQRVIQQKEREIVDTANRLSSGENTDSDDTLKIKGSIYKSSKSVAALSTAAGVVAAAGASYSDDLDQEFDATLATDSDIKSNGPISASDETAMNNADTIAISPSELLDSTIQMSAEDFIHQNSLLPLPADTDLEDLIDETADVSGLFMEDMEESTLALDDDSLALAKRPFPLSNVD